MVVRYYHDLIGVNSRLDSIQAAILNVKLKYLNEYSEARKKAANAYNQALSKSKNLQVPEQFTQSTHVFHQYTLLTKNIDREGLHLYLESKGIPAPIYYPVPLHLQKAYQDPRYKEGDFPVTEDVCKRVLSLPMHTEIDDEQIAFITESVLEFVNK